MVRETRHLWVGNLPDNIREDRIREHFKRYGRVQNAKLLGRAESASAGVGGAGASGVCATVAFMDIKSASKAHNAEHVLDERTLTTEYYEPAAIPSTAGAPSAGSSPAGSGYSGSSSSVNSVPAPSSASRYHLSGGEDSSGATTCPIAASAAAPATWRGTNDSATEYCRRGNTPAAYGRYQRNNSTAPYSTPPSNLERTTPHHRWYASGERTGATGGESTPSTPGGGTESGRRRRHSGSASSRSDSSSPEPSDTSRASTPATQPPLSHHNNHRTPPAASHQWATTASGRPLSICVRNLPTRSTDSSLKDGLYHEYKKHGKVVWVKVVGQNADRYAVVRFKKPSDVEKALEVSQDKLFFGCKISVAPHQSCDDDAESTKPYETDIDEYHPKATRTLFIGNLEKDVTQQQLRDKFKHFGRIIEIDIKKGSGGGAGYAFCQYASISSVVEAIRAMDGEYVGGSRVKLGFGKPVATACVWVDGLTEHTEKQVLGAVSRCGAATSVCVDRAAGAALVHFEQAAAAGGAVRELRRVASAASAAEPDHPRLCVDYASRECQDAFYEQLEKHGGSAALAGSERLSGELSARYVPSTRHDSVRFEGCGSRSRASSYGRSASRTPRHSAHEHYDPVDYAADRRYRVYDETGTSPPVEDSPFEDRLQSVVVSPHRARRHHRDSSPEDRKHSKERRRSAGGGSARRSRSGSANRERHVSRRKHRRRHDGSGSRAGTPLRDEPDAPPAEPRRPPRDRPPLPMCLPLPKFAAQLLRAVPPAPRPTPQPAPAPDSPPRPPSVSSSSGGSAPHSPSLEERIRSLDEKYEKWSGSRAVTEAPDRARLRHRLLEVDINEVKPSEVVSALLAKRSVFDEDSERLECVVRPPSPSDGRARVCAPRVPRYPPLPIHPLPMPTVHCVPHHQPQDVDGSDRPSDPRLNRPERPCRLEKLGKINESDYRECRPRPRTPSTDRSQQDCSERRSPPALVDGDAESRSRDSATGTCDAESKSSFDTDDKEMELGIKRERSNSSTSDSLLTGKSESITSIPLSQNVNNRIEENRRLDTSQMFQLDQKCARDVIDMLLKKVEHSQKLEPQLEKSSKVTNDHKFEFFKGEPSPLIENEPKIATCEKTKKSENNKIQMFSPNSITNKDFVENDIQLHHKNSSILSKNKDKDAIKPDMNKCDKNDPDRYNHNIISQVYQTIKLEKENIQIEKHLEKEKQSCVSADKKLFETDKNIEDRVVRNDRDKVRHSKERLIKEKHDSEKDKFKNNRNDKSMEKSERDRKLKEENSAERNHMDKMDKNKTEKDTEKLHKDKTEADKLKHAEDKSRHDHHKKDKSEKDKRKESEIDSIHNKSKKEDRHKAEKSKKDSDAKRESKKESEPIKSRKSSRDESSREICRKDSTDSSTSRASHESSKSKDLDNHDIKDDLKPRVKLTDLFLKLETDKESINTKIKSEIREEKFTPSILKAHDIMSEPNIKPKAEVIEKHRHHSVDSPNVDSKRKERLNSCSSLPSNIGHKRRISSHDSFDSVCDDAKKNKNEPKLPERRDSKDSRSGDKHKTTKFSKGHFAKIIENKTKEEKKGHVKPLDEALIELRDNETKNLNAKGVKKTPKEDNCEGNANEHTGESHNNLDFLALFELRSSEEDERQKALRKEMKEKKRIQQLQQIQELQLQQDAMQQGELLSKQKDDKKLKLEDKKKEAREKRFSLDRKSREDKSDNGKKKNRKHVQSSDTSDSDEPKKHSIFDIIDDGPTYISMYDKVKARSCKNMQKQEEEKRQEKIKAKFSQLKQSRAKREEKKRSSWDEDSDSEHEGHRKPQKSSLDNSSEDDSIKIHSKKRDKMHTSNIDFDENKTEDYFSTPNDDDLRNKLARKNSRTRIMSDSSDDDTSKSKSPNYLSEGKKFNMSDSESLTTNKIDSSKDFDEQIKKNSLLNLFGKSDSDDSKLKSNIENENSYKLPSFKSVCNDLSSESESVTSNRNSGEFRRKHKKKPKKYKSSYSDEENKIDHSDSGVADGENRQKISEKQCRHSSKKDKRREKNRDSIDTDDGRDEKVKTRREKRSPDDMIGFEYGSDIISNNIKRDGKMEDIFGPLSDESDKDTAESHNKLDFSGHDFDSLKERLNSTDLKPKEKDDARRIKKEKKRKEKRWLVREDDNSLDMDAVSKAIEARLFAESLTDDDNRIRMDSLDENRRENSDHKYMDSNLLNDVVKFNSKHDKVRRDSREKKKKRKRNKEERLNRKEQHPFYHLESFEKSDNEISEKPVLESMTNTMLLDIPLPNDSQTVEENTEDGNSLAMSPSLPRLTESPPISMQSILDEETKCGASSSSSIILGEDEKNVYMETKDIEIEQIPMPPPFENIVQDISEVPLPTDPEPINFNENKTDNFIATLSSDSDISEDAIPTISVIETEIDKIVEIDTTVDKNIDKIDVPLSKVEKKPEEKPRAIISQEETEDAVAALLGESFGGKINTFSNYEEPENNTAHQNDHETISLNTENIPEEDAEEMRQAVQNLNACEMELKPDTPVSDNDLLLIDTDTEEADEAPQDSSEKVSVNVSTNVTSTNNTEIIKPAGEPQVRVSIAKSIEPDLTKSHSSEADNKTNETEVKIQLPRRENVQIITSTATPVITSWTLTNNKMLEPHVINIQPNVSSNKDKNETKPNHLTTNIVQIKTSQTQNVQINNIVKPVLAPTRVSAPYQVISQIVRPQVSHMQPPTIKIPEPHILYQKSQGIVISPRLANDSRMQSPKAGPQADGMTSPRLATVPVLSASPQNLNSTGMVSPNSIHQRSPGQVTVVRVQQPPLSPIQAMHLPPGTRTILSPNRPNSVLVQTQGSPLHHHNRLPVTPILTPIPKQINVSTVLQQNKGMGVNSSPMLAQQKIITADARKNDPRNMSENKNDNAKIILSPTSLQHSTNPTVMAQNRLISMQNAVHLGNINSPLHLNNKFVLNKVTSINEKRENVHQKASDHGGHSPFVSSPIIHVAGVNHSTSSIIQSGTKSVVCNLQEASNISRGQGSNVIHTLNSQRLLTPVSINNVRQLDINKMPPSVLSMASIRPSTVLTKIESSNITTPATSNVTNIAPILIKSGATIGTIRINTKAEKDNVQILASVVQKETKTNDKTEKEISPVTESDTGNKQNIFALKPLQNSSEGNITSKCETDFEELLKDNTNKIIVTKDPEKKLEINVGKTTTLVTPNMQSQNKQHLNSSEHGFSKKEQEVPTSQAVPEQDALESTLKQNKDDKTKEVDDMNKNNTPNTPKDVTSKETPKENVTIQPINVNITPNDNAASEMVQREKNHKLNSEPLLNKAYENVSIDKEETCFDFVKSNITEEQNVNETVNQMENIVNQLKTMDENDSWSAKDLNIESVIKKVDSLCNDIVDTFKTTPESQIIEKAEEVTSTPEPVTEMANHETHLDNLDTENIDTSSENIVKDTNIKTFVNVSGAKRGGRSVRGKKSEKNQDRVQTRQIAKTPRGGTAKRGRGRAKVDKKIKNLVTSNTSTMPGDIYDFHEDSGDEGSSNKTEPRPRLILTIKSPLSGQVGVTATSTLSIAQKDQNKFEERRPSRDEKPEDFVSPSPNTRKSRRLQEKDVHRNVAYDIGEEGARNARSAKRRPIRQAAVTKPPTNALDKALVADTRKSPRGTKRTRDRSLSDASVDSGDGDVRRDEVIRESKIPRLDEVAAPLGDAEPMSTPRPVPPSASGLPITSKVIVSHVTPPVGTAAAAHQVSSTGPTLAPAAVALPVTLPASLPVTPSVALPVKPPVAPSVASPVAPPVVPPAAQPVTTLVLPVVPAPIPTPITKPPKKMISEISAKLAGAFEAAVQNRSEPEPLRDPPPAAPATGEAQAGDARRPGDSVPCAMLPVGATEAADARVASPALPHRPPRAVSDRATPVLIRGGEGEAGAAGAVGAVGALGAVGVRPRSLAAGGGGAASLPRGAHHPPPEAPPLAKALPAAVGGAHHLPLHHHPGAASRITSVPSISPQGQLALSAELVRSPPPAHQQTSPIASGEGMYPHFSQQHFQMYQQHFRATQHETRATPSPFTRLEAEGSEAPTSPLELRRMSARVPRPAHSPSPADRHIMYAVKCGRSPPPAHGGFASRAAGALPPGAAGAAGAPPPGAGGALPPGAAGAAGPPGPPHASQVPHEADSLQMLLRRYPVMWQGLLALKNDSAAVQMHFVGGNPRVASETLARPSDLATPLLRIAQRMRLEPLQLDQVHRKMKLENEHCILLALPCGRDHMDVLQQSTNLSAGFITYLQRKTAAGIVNIAPPGHHQAMFTVHIFPSCDFANENLSRIAPDLMHRVADIAHLLIVIATV